jgi:hypothetical protein
MSLRMGETVESQNACLRLNVPVSSNHDTSLVVMAINSLETL